MSKNVEIYWCVTCKAVYDKGFKYPACGMCGHTEFTDKDPYEHKKRSMRAMWKRKEKKSKGTYVERVREDNIEEAATKLQKIQRESKQPKTNG